MNKTCYYRGYRDEEGQLKGFYWKLLVVRLAFVIIFEVRQIMRYSNSEPTVGIIISVFLCTYSMLSLEFVDWLIFWFLIFHNLCQSNWRGSGIWLNKYCKTPTMSWRYYFTPITLYVMCTASTKNFTKKYHRFTVQSFFFYKKKEI